MTTERWLIGDDVRVLTLIDEAQGTKILQGEDGYWLMLPHGDGFTKHGPYQAIETARYDRWAYLARSNSKASARQRRYGRYSK